MSRLLGTSLVLVLLASLAAAAPARRRPIYGDVPLDRYLRGKVLEMKGREVRIAYDFEDAEQFKDFYYRRPFRKATTGSFEVVDGVLRAAGAAGLLLSVGFEPDLNATIQMKLAAPSHDIGMFVMDRYAPLRATLFAIRETWHSQFDNQRPEDHTIVEVGSVGNPLTGILEYRWVARKAEPEVPEGSTVLLGMEHDGKTSVFRIDKEEFQGGDVGTPLTSVEAGLFTIGGRAYFDDFVVEGTLDESWLATRRIALFLENDLENPANRLTPLDKKALTLLRQAEKKEAPATDILSTIANARVLVFLRERLAATLIDTDRAAEALDSVVPLLGSREAGARAFGSKILASAIKIDFGYHPEASPDSRRDAIARIKDYVKHRAEREAKGQSFVGGAWRTPAELEALRMRWEYAREIRTTHFLLRTNTTRERAETTARLLEAGYDAFRQFLGREPSTEKLPLQVFVFANNKDYTEWCNTNKQDRFATYYRLVLGKQGLGLVSFQFQQNEGILNVAARLYHRAVIGHSMPLWYEEAFATYFSWMGAYSWAGGRLIAGKPLTGGDRNYLRGIAGSKDWIPIDRLITMRSRDLVDKTLRRTYYLQTWALLYFFTKTHGYDVRWSEYVERCHLANLDDTNSREEGERIFRESFEGRISRLEKDWIAWIRTLR